MGDIASIEMATGERLQVMLADATRHAFRAARERYPDERIYMFGLYSTEMYRWFDPFLLGEDGLDEVTSRYQAYEHYQNRTRESIKADLRWSVADSPYDEFEIEQFQPITRLIAEFNPEPDYQLDFDGPEWTVFQRRVEIIKQAAIDALNALDLEGLFGAGPKRHAIVIGIDLGDQSDRSRWEFATALNPSLALGEYRKAMRLKVPRGDMRILSPERVRDINGIGVSPRTKSIVVAGPSAIAGWRFSGQLFFAAKVDNHDDVWSLEVSVDGGLMLARQQHAIRRFDLKRGVELERIPYTGAHETKLLSIALSRDQRRLVIADWASQMTMTAYDSGATIWRREQFAYDVAFSPDDARLLVVGDGVRVLDATTGAVTRVLMGPGERPTDDSAGAWSPDGRWLAASRQSRGGPATLWLWDDMLELRATWTLPGEDDPASVRAIAFSPKSDMVATADADGDLRVWRCPDGALMLDVCGRWESLSDVAWIDQEQIAAVGYDPDGGPPFGIWDVPKPRAEAKRRALWSRFVR